MLVLEQIESVDREELKQQNHIHKDTECSEETTIYGHVNHHMEKNISSTLRKIYDAFESYGKSEHLSNDKAIENLVKKFQKSIKDAKENKCMFSVPSLILSNKLSIMEYSMLVLHHLMECDANVTEVGKRKLQPLWSEMVDLVSTGTGVNQAVWELLPVGTWEKHNNYLSGLKQVVFDSIKKGEKKDVTVKRDNAFYCVKCPEKSVITPAKFLSKPEFKNLNGALKIGEGDDVIRMQDGKYHDIKGRFQMTFPISNSEKIVMTLSSEKADKPENASSFGKIMVHMNDKSCEIFSKYLKELEKEPRISKVVEAAKSFAQKKSSEVSPPLSNMKSADISQHSQSSGQSVSS